MKLTNEKINQYNWLAEMYSDSYYPTFLVDKIKAILLEVCQNIEEKQPKNLEELYEITNVGVLKINDLQDKFGENESELETVARECMGMDFDFIAKAYDFNDADGEALIYERDW